MTSAAKLQITEELLKSGLINKKEALKLLGFEMKEPKFKKGEKVWHINGYPAIVENVGTDDDLNITYHLKCHGQSRIIWWKEEELISEYQHDFDEMLKK